MTENMAVSLPNLKKSASERASISKSETMGSKKNHFVDGKKNQRNTKKSIEMGFEYDKDVLNDADFFNKIFAHNCYNPSSENLIDYYLEIRRMIDEFGDREQGNVGAFLGMTVIGLFGFLGFSFTIIGGIAGGVIGGTLGRYAGKKLRRKIKRKGPLTQEQLFITKLQCVVKMGKLQRDYLKHNLNKYRILLEKMMEESSVALNINCFEDTKKITKVLIKFRNFMLGVQPQKALLLCYKLFKIYLKQIDYQDEDTLQEVAGKISNIMIPYVKLMEVSESNDEKKKIKKLTKLISYQKIKKLINKPEIQAILRKYPDVRDSEEFLNKFKEFLRQTVNLEAPMNPELEKNIQEEAQEQFLGRDGVSPAILKQIENVPDAVKEVDYDDDKILTLDDIHGSELDEISPRKSIQQIKNSNVPRSRIFEDNVVGNVRASFIPSKMFSSQQVTRVKTPLSVNIDHEGNQLTSKKLSNQIIDDDSSLSEDSSVSRELDQISLEDAKKLVDDSALYEAGDDSISRQDIKINSRNSLSAKKGSPKRVPERPEDMRLDINNLNIGSRTGSRDLEKSNRSRASSPVKNQTMSLDNVEVHFDPKRTVKGPEIVKINSCTNVVNEEEEEEKKEEIKQAEEEMFRRRDEEKKKSYKDLPQRLASRSATITKENEQKFNNLIQKSAPSKTKKELIFEKIIGIAYDNVSKWEKVVASPVITIHKIKPENSPVVLIRAWAFLEGFSVGEVFNQIFNIQERSRWDTVLADCAVLEQLDEDSELFYFCIKTPFGISERDFLQRRQHQKDYPEKGTIMISFQSIEHPTRPPFKNKVRGETHIAGYIIKPSEKDPNSTDLCILTQVDIKGNIPKAIVNMVSGKAPADWFAKLKKACEDFKKRNPNVKL